MKLKKRLWMLIFLLIPSLALAQEDDACPALVKTALEVTRQGCLATGLNQACYGHLVLEAEAQPGYADFKFEQPGDIVAVTQMQSLRLSSMDTVTGRWGVVLMQIAAGLIKARTQEVTMIMFGDVAVNSAVRLIPVTATTDMNIRSGPSTRTAVIGTLAANTTTAASARTEDSRWLRVRLPGDEGGIGWVSADLVTSSVKFDTLEVAAENEPAPESTQIRPQFGPMQAFYFETGRDDAPCAEAPDSGVLIQTPEGAAEITLWMNEVLIHLNATAFVQSQPGGEMTVSVIEGYVRVEADGQSRTAVAGTKIAIPVDDDSKAAGPPTSPEPYDEGDVNGLPLELLKEDVTISKPLDVPAGTPLAGTWAFGWGVDEMTCPNGKKVTFQTAVVDTALSVSSGGGSISLLSDEYSRESTGVYTAVYTDSSGNLHRDTLNVVSSDLIVGSAQIEFIGLDCTLSVPFQLSLMRTSG